MVFLPILTNFFGYRQVMNLATPHYIGDRRPRKTLVNIGIEPTKSNQINFFNHHILFCCMCLNSTPRGNRTLTNSRSRDFKSRASTYSAMDAYCGEHVQRYFEQVRRYFERQPALLFPLSIAIPMLICLHHKPGKKEIHSY